MTLDFEPVAEKQLFVYDPSFYNRRLWMLRISKPTTDQNEPGSWICKVEIEDSETGKLKVLYVTHGNSAFQALASNFHFVALLINKFEKNGFRLATLDGPEKQTAIEILRKIFHTETSIAVQPATKEDCVRRIAYMRFIAKRIPRIETLAFTLYAPIIRRNRCFAAIRIVSPDGDLILKTEGKDSFDALTAALQVSYAEILKRYDETWSFSIKQSDTHIYSCGEIQSIYFPMTGNNPGVFQKTLADQPFQESQRFAKLFHLNQL